MEFELKRGDTVFFGSIEYLLLYLLKLDSSSNKLKICLN